MNLLSPFELNENESEGFIFKSINLQGQWKIEDTTAVTMF